MSDSKREKENWVSFSLLYRRTRELCNQNDIHTPHPMQKKTKELTLRSTPQDKLFPNNSGR